MDNNISKAPNMDHRFPPNTMRYPNYGPMPPFMLPYPGHQFPIQPPNNLHQLGKSNSSELSNELKSLFRSIPKENESSEAVEVHNDESSPANVLSTLFGQSCPKKVEIKPPSPKIVLEKEEKEIEKKKEVSKEFVQLINGICGKVIGKKTEIVDIESKSTFKFIIKSPETSSSSSDDRVVRLIGKLINNRHTYTIEELIKAAAFGASHIVPSGFKGSNAEYEPYLKSTRIREVKGRYVYKRSSTAWIPIEEKLRKLSPDERQFEKFRISIQSSINKLAATNYHKISEAVSLIPFPTENHVNFFVECVYNTITRNHSWMKNYATLIMIVFKNLVAVKSSMAEYLKVNLFNKLTYGCIVQDEWYSHYNSLKDSLKSVNEDDADEINEEILTIEDKKRKEVIGCIMLISQLFLLEFFDKAQVLTFAKGFSQFKHDFETEIICSFVNVTYTLYKNSDPAFYNEIVTGLKNLKITHSSRIRFMVKDCIDATQTPTFRSNINKSRFFGDAPQKTGPSHFPKRTKTNDGVKANNDSKYWNKDFSSSRYKSENESTQNSSNFTNKYSGITSIPENASSRNTHPRRVISEHQNTRPGIKANNQNIHNRQPVAEFSHPSKPAYIQPQKPIPQVVAPKFTNPEGMAVDEQFKTFVVPLYDQYASDYNIDVINSNLKLIEISHYPRILISKSFSYFVEEISSLHEYFGFLIFSLLDGSRLATSDFIEGFNDFVQLIPDLIIDIPKIWDAIERLIAPIVCSSHYTLKDYFNSLNACKVDEVELRIFSLLDYIRVNTSKLTAIMVWKSFGIPFKSFFKSEIVLQSIHKFDFFEDPSIENKLFFGFQVIRDSSIERLSAFDSKVDSLNDSEIIENVQDFARLVHFCCPPGPTSTIDEYLNEVSRLHKSTFKLFMSNIECKKAFITTIQSCLELYSDKPLSFLNLLFKVLTSHNLVDGDFSAFLH